MKRFRFVILLILLVILGFQIKTRLPELRELPNLIAQANLGLIGLAFSGLFLSYAADGVLSQTILKILGFPLRFAQTVQIALLDVFAEQTLPLGGMGAVATCYFFYRRIGIPQNALFFLSTTWAVLTSGSLVVLFLVSLPFLPYHTSLSLTLNYKVLSLLSFALAIMFAIVVTFFSVTTKGRHVLFRVKTLIRNLTLKQTFKTNFGKVKANPYLDLLAFLSALIYYLGQLLCLYASLRAFAVAVSFPAAVFSLTISLIVSWLSFIPGGIGVAESSLSLILLSFGYPVAGVVAGVLLFRVISFWIILPIGGLFYVKLEQQYGKIVRAVESET